MASSDSLELWRERVAAMQQSGTSAKQWCEQNGISANLFYYWKHCLLRGQKDARETDWLPAVVCDRVVAPEQRQQDSVTLRVAGAVIEVHHGFNPKLLRDVVLALGSEQC